MKRFMTLLLLALLSLSLLLSGCSEQEPVPVPETKQGDVPFMNSFYYDTVEELCGGISSYFTGDVLQEYEDHYGTARGGVFRSFITNLQNGSVPLYVPYYQGEEIAYMNEEGFPNIVLFPSESFYQPWIFFLGDKGVSIMYLDNDMKDKDIKWIVDKINTSTTGAETKPFYEYNEIDERDIKLSDRTIVAVDCIRKKGTAQSIHTYFVYDDILVLVNKVGTQTDIWLKDFSFEKIYLDE